MKNHLLLSILLITSQLSMAQLITLVPTDPASPTKGTVVFDNATSLLKYWNGTVWIPITNAATATGWGVSGNDIYNANTRNVGIGTTTPKATFNVAEGKTVFFGADTSGAGNELIWYPSKGAFRAGISLANGWDYSNVGNYSTATGSSIAGGNSSTAMGASVANGQYSPTAMGSSIAGGSYSTAMGASNASGDKSTAMGTSTASGYGSTAIGYGNIASFDYTMAIGKYNQDIASSALVIGNGSYNSNTNVITRSNIMTVMMDGKVGIGTTAPQEALHIQGSAIISSYLGIGTTTPIAPLHVVTSNLLSNSTNHYFSWGTGTSISTLGNGYHNIGILAEYDIVTKNSFVSSQTVTTSDARIKNIIGLSNNQQDLATLCKIKITDYHYKDIVMWGNQTFKKVIAQQVEEVFPQAVRKQTSTIPDIYSLAEKVNFDADNKTLTILLSKSYDIKIGEKIEIIHPDKGKIQAVVESVSGNSFTVKDWQYPTDKIFVFGREVNDFRVIDYEAISMLGISAIQELAKENEELKSKLKRLEGDFSNRIAILEALILKKPSGEIR